MDNHFNQICALHQYRNHFDKLSIDECYSNMDLCSQAQIDDSADNILTRMNELRRFSKEMQEKSGKAQRMQRSFSF